MKKIEALMLKVNSIVQLPAFVCMNHYFQTLDVHVFDNKLDINNHETVSYEKDMNDISN